MFDVSLVPARRVRPDFIDWSLRIVLAIFFLYFGLEKFGASRFWPRVFGQIGLGQWFQYATGAIEVVGAILLVIPRATLVVVTMLACTMIGALLVHVSITGLGPQSILVALVICELLAIASRRHLSVHRLSSVYE
jgi:uncharacterized membrane protein YphA (DoxX/SURF4 family)